jgi:hypothetical protein
MKFYKREDYLNTIILAPNLILVNYEFSSDTKKYPLDTKYFCLFSFLITGLKLISIANFCLLSNWIEIGKILVA